MGTVLLAATLFVATNIDDIFILVAFFADPKYRAREVIAGQYLGIVALIVVSLVAALAALIIPAGYIGLLGLAPIAIGCKQLLELWRNSGGDEDDAPQRPAGSGAGRILAVALVTVANGGDNLGVYIPVFAVRSGVETVAICIVFVVMTAVLCVLARGMVTHRTLGAPIRRYGRWITPFVLIAVGLLILLEANQAVTNLREATFH
jgi:cadmium resistance transport/sequestration family protein